MCYPTLVPTKMAAHRYENLSKLWKLINLAWQWNSHNDKWTAYNGSFKFLQISIIKFVASSVKWRIPSDFSY